MATVYSPEGGSYRSFKAPSYVGPYDSIPFSMIFLPAEEVVTLQNAIIIDNLIGDVVSLFAAGKTAQEVIAAVKAKTGITFSTKSIIWLSVIGSKKFIEWIDKASLALVTKNYSKVRLTRVTTNGILTNLYSGWVGDYVSDEPYSDYKPILYKGEYDVKK